MMDIHIVARRTYSDLCSTAVVIAVDPPPRIMLVRAKWRKPRLFARLHISGQRGNGSISLHTAISAHKSEEVRELIEGRGCEVLFLPPYSPDYNPIEEAFSKIKGLLRK